jgi:hypothetical protein
MTYKLNSVKFALKLPPVDHFRAAVRENILFAVGATVTKPIALNVFPRMRSIRAKVSGFGYESQAISLFAFLTPADRSAVVNDNFFVVILSH